MLGIKGWRTRSLSMSIGLGEWEQLLLTYNAKCHQVIYEAFLDLSLNNEEILGCMFKTHSNHIKKSKDLWRVEIISGRNDKEEIHKIFCQFRAMHIEISGRETRGIATWRKQEEALMHTNDFLVLLFAADRMIGVSLFQTTGSVGVYSVAVYDRNLFDKPVAHISQWAAIQHMKELGLKWYYIGRRNYSADWDIPTSKEVSIGHFKEGFSSNIFVRLLLDVDTLEEI